MSRIKLNENDHVQGSTDAPIVLVEYGDYECYYCGKAFPIVKNIQKRLGDKLCFVFRNYPIEELHEHAVHAAIAAETAARAGKFWEMHDMLYENQRALDDRSLVAYAKSIGLDPTKFEQDFGSEETIDKVQADIDSANALGIHGTPAFFVNGKAFEGDWTGTNLLDYLESLL